MIPPANTKSRIAAAAKKHGKALGRPARTAEHIKKFRKQGFQFFMTATDMDFMADGAAQVLQPFGKKRHITGVQAI